MKKDVLWDVMIDSNIYRTFDPGDYLSQTVQFSDMFQSNQLLLDSWEIPNLKLFRYEGEEQKPLADFMSGFDVPSVRKEATEVIRPLVEGTVEFLPLETEIGNYFALHVKFLDCLDASRSVVERAEEDGSIIGVDRYAFHWDRLRDAHMFRIPEQGLSRLFVSASFKSIYEENKWTGLLFYPVPITEA